MLMQGGGTLLAQCKNTLWKILEAEENATKSSSPALDRDQGDGEASSERAPTPESSDCNTLEGITKMGLVNFSPNDNDSENSGLIQKVKDLESIGVNFDSVDLLQGAAGCPPALPLMGCTAKGIDCEDCKCKVVFKSCNGKCFYYI